MVTGTAVLAVGRDGGGRPFALDGICPHAGGPPGQGWLDGEALVCPLHGWAYRVSEGVCTTFAALTVLRYPCRGDGDDVLVDVVEGDREGRA